MSKNSFAKINFYYVDNEYISFLKQAEMNSRGFTCVPNIQYAGNSLKFVYGAVLEIYNVKFFVPVSSQYGKHKEFNLDIKTKGKVKYKGSLRFPYMIPVPNSCLNPLIIDDITQEKRKIRTAKELAFCRKNKDKIERMALHTYEAVTKGVNPKLLTNSCDFKLLEQKCLEYEMSLQQEPSSAPTAEPILPNELPELDGQGFGGIGGMSA